MSTYLDTSVLAAYYLPEPLSAKVEAAFRRLDNPVVSLLVAVELASAISRRVRTRELTPEMGRAALDLFRSHEAGGFYRLVALTSEHYASARGWIERLDSPLRTLDALHLSVAHHESLDFLTADKRLRQAARKLGLRSRLIA